MLYSEVIVQMLLEFPQKIIIQRIVIDRTGAFHWMACGQQGA
jgi:hypothetical protein